MNILKSIKINQWKFVPILGIGYRKSEYTGEYGHTGYVHTLQLPFVLYQRGIVNIIKQEKLLIDIIKEIIDNIRISKKLSWDARFDVKIKLSERDMEIFHQELLKECETAGLIVIQGNDIATNVPINTYHTYDGKSIYIDHESKNNLFSIELIEKNEILSN